MKKYLLYLSCISGLMFCVCSCKYTNEYQTVNAQNEFTATIPSWLKEETTLAEGAPFQYANRFRNFYVIGFAAKKDTVQSDFNTYWNNNLSALKNSLTTPLVTDSLSIKVNGMKGMRAEILGIMDGENIYFSEVVLESETKFYHISVWVRNEERKLRFKEDINKIIASVKEL